MKILPRTTGIWESASWDPRRQKYVTGDTDIFPRMFNDAGLYAVQHEDGDPKYVKCSSCGEIIAETEIDAHILKGVGWSIDSCKNCRHYTKSPRYPYEVTDIRNEEGKLIRTQKCKVLEACTYTFPHQTLTAGAPPEQCERVICQNAEIEPVKTFHDEKPDVFSSIPMSTVLRTDKWTREEYGFKRRGRYSIYACVNSKSMISYFTCSFRRDSKQCFYSPKEKEWYYDYLGKYVKGLPGFVTARPEYLKTMRKIAEELDGYHA